MGRPPIGKVAMSGVERVKRWRLKHPANKPAPTKRAAPDSDAIAKAVADAVAPLRARIRELDAELARERALRVEAEAKVDARSNARPEPPPLPRTSEELLARRTAERERVAAKPKAEKPPLPPDEQRERRIAALTTRVRNLTGELNHFKKWHESEMQERGGMSFTTRAAISKALRDDRETTDAERDHALKLFNAYISDGRKAGKR
jgi:hypothetical protein